MSPRIYVTRADKKINQFRLKSVKSENIQKTKVYEIRNGKCPSFILENGIRWSLLIYTIMLLVNQLKKK